MEQSGSMVIVGLWVALAGAPPLLAQCVGDCNSDERVTVDELVLGVNVALGSANVSICTLLDANADDRVSVNELVAAVDKSLGGCAYRSPTPTKTVTATAKATATATATTKATATRVVGATATPIVVPGCDNGTVEGTFSALANTNAETSPASLTLVAAGETRDPRSGRYFWAINGNTCDTDAGLLRSVQIQVIGPATGFAPGSYALTPPLASLVYVESPAFGSVQPRIWQTTGAMLVIDSVSGGLTFHIDAAPMVPNLIVAGDPPPMGTFNLSVTGTIKRVTSN